VQGQRGSVGVFYVCAFWGDQADLHRFVQMYAVEKAKLEARKQGHAVFEQPLADGSIRLAIQVGEGT